MIKVDSRYSRAEYISGVQKEKLSFFSIKKSRKVVPYVLLCMHMCCFSCLVKLYIPMGHCSALVRFLWNTTINKKTKQNMKDENKASLEQQV